MTSPSLRSLSATFPPIAYPSVPHGAAPRTLAFDEPSVLAQLNTRHVVIATESAPRPSAPARIVSAALTALARTEGDLPHPHKQPRS